MPNESTTPTESDERKSGKRSRRIHLILCYLAGFILLSVLWYSTYRTFFTGPKIRIYESTTAATNNQTNNSLRIGTYNIAHGRGPDSGTWEKFHGGGRTARRKRLDAIAELLRTNNLDVVILNEVDFAVLNSWHVNQAEHIARKAGFPFRLEQRNYDANLFGLRFQAGNAVLSRHPIAEAESIDYPSSRTAQKALLGNKQGVICTIIPRTGIPFRLIPVHLNHESIPTRLASAKILVTLASNDPLPTILAGDFNSAPSGVPPADRNDGRRSALDLFTNAFTHLPSVSTNSDHLATYPSENPNLALDWILIPDNWAPQSFAIPHSTLSDHLPVIAEFVPHPSIAGTLNQ